MMLVSIETILWLVVLFALAGPALISGIYEAAMNSRILIHLQGRIQNKKLSVAQRAQLMYTVLVGHLDMLAFPENGDEHDNPWNHINGPGGLLHRLRPTGNKKKDMKSGITFTQASLGRLLPTDFGISVGAPVVFFCGSFLYTLFENYASLGDHDIGHALGTCPQLPQVISWLLLMVWAQLSACFL